MSTTHSERPAADDSVAAALAKPSFARRMRWPLLIGGPILLALAVLAFWLSGGRYVATDDAYVQAARVDISSNVPGRVIEVDVRDNQSVAIGQTLFRLDTRPFDTAAREAAAQLASAQANLTGQRALVGERRAELAAAVATLDYQTRELARMKALTGAGVTSQQQLDAQAHAVDAAKAQRDAAREALATAQAALGAAAAGQGASPAVRQAEAALERARLNQSYGIVSAPQPGTVTKVDQLQVGDYVNAAQPVFSLVSNRMWIEANFKEDQLAHMRVGQTATIKVDAFPEARITGHVDSLSPGTGSSFAILPAENATGNWVKVVQRVPVRVAIDEIPKDVRLHAGLSAKVTVDTEQHRSLFGGH